MDEGSISDYVQILGGGSIDTAYEHINTAGKSIGANAEVKVNARTKLLKAIIESMLVEE